jgi:hypothetical protein
MFMLKLPRTSAIVLQELKRAAEAAAAAAAEARSKAMQLSVQQLAEQQALHEVPIPSSKIAF